MKDASKVLAVAGFFALFLFGSIASPASAAFGLKDLEISITGSNGDPPLQAGSHPYAVTTKLAVETEVKSGKVVPVEETKDLKISLPPGFVGDPTAVSRCTAAEFLAGENGECPNSSAVGLTKVEFGEPGGFQVDPVYNLVPSPGTLFKLGFIVEGRAPVTVDIRLNPEEPHNGIASPTNISQTLFFFGAELTVWGVPADPTHDSLRGTCLDKAGKSLGNNCSAGIREKPFLTLPTSCADPLTADFEADSWQHPGVWFKETIAVQGSADSRPTGCAKLGFAPEISAQPTNHSAEGPSGLDFGVAVDDEGLISPTGKADSTVKKAVVTLPEGITLNPSVAEGLVTCSPAQLKAEKLDTAPGQGCPEASKIGTVEVETPLLEGELLKGSVFVATQNQNPFNSLVAIYIVIRDRELGILVKLAAKIEPDPNTGRLITTLDDAPQLPFSSFSFHFREGGRSPLITPPLCGNYLVEAQFTPWANPAGPVPVPPADFDIVGGVGGGPCAPGGAPPFLPGFGAGTLNNQAAAYSPFNMRLTRRDGDQDLVRFSALLPPGLIGKLAGVTKCPETAIAAAKAKTGKAELASPSCPPGSRIGHTLAGAGVGSELTYVGGQLYLGGPFGGAPLSVVSITPAVAGPFDVGTVVVREALSLDPRSAEVKADGAHSDPIPHKLAGIPLKLRDLRVYVDRKDFILNPTNCDLFQTRATVFGGGSFFSPAGEIPVSLAERFVAANCAKLGFKPSFDLRLRGGTRRGSHPALHAVVTPRAGDANFNQAVVTLPRSAFLDQAHIRTICTRVQFAAKACPAGSIYGKATLFTPLLDESLTGPAYLRSSNHKLPDLVIALHGIVDIEVVGRLDSHNGGIRTTFEDAPDAPFSKFVLDMQGGQKGLIINSRDLCAHSSRAIARLIGQNGRRDDFQPLVRPSCKKSSKAKRHRRSR